MIYITTIDYLKGYYSNEEKARKMEADGYPAPIIVLGDYSSFTAREMFMEILNSDNNAFKDELSVKYLKEVYNRERIGEFEMASEIYEKPECLATLGCDPAVGLMLLRYGREKQPHVVLNSLGAADKETWKWMSENTDLYLYVERTSMCYVWMHALTDITIDGKDYSGAKRLDFMDEFYTPQYQDWIMTKRRENIAYEEYAAQRENYVTFDLKEELSFDAFQDRFPTSYPQESGKFYEGGDRIVDIWEYRVTNYCEVIPQISQRKNPIYICGKTKDGYECRKILPVKYPTFLEILSDVLENYVVEYHKNQECLYLADIYEEWFALVLYGNERCDPLRYPEDVRYGIWMKPKEKQIEICNAHQSIEIFHRLFAYTDGEIED